MRVGGTQRIISHLPVLLATLVTVVALTNAPGEAAATTGRFHPPRTAAQARRAALADARERLAKVVPPPGATRIRSAPAGTHLAEPPGRTERGRRIDLARFWQTGESPIQVLRWFRLHHPGGSYLDDEGPLLFDGVAIRHVYSFEFGELAPIASWRSVLVSVVPVTEGTVIRVDSQDAWEVPHPRAERIPPNAGFAKLERIIYRPKQKTMVKLHGRKVHTVAELINNLPIVGPRAGGHEERLTGELKITFRSREGDRELASVRYQETVHFGYSVEVTVPKRNHSNFVDHWGGRRLVRDLEPFFAQGRRPRPTRFPVALKTEPRGLDLSEIYETVEHPNKGLCAGLAAAAPRREKPAGPAEPASVRIQVRLGHARRSETLGGGRHPSDLHRLGRPGA